jgi:DNA-binding LacI/PurR family transcriptional regulator
MTATIKDVAALAGTSTATVSKVMNKSYSISQETIDRVHKAMEELDYHPNLRARNFARKSTKTVVFITTLGEHVGFANPHMFEMMSGMEQALSIRDYSLIVKNIEQENACTYIREVIDTKLVDGVIIHASVISKELDQLIYEESIPHIVIGIPSFRIIFAGLISIIAWLGNLLRNIYWR